MNDEGILTNDEAFIQIVKGFAGTQSVMANSEVIPTDELWSGISIPFCPYAEGFTGMPLTGATYVLIGRMGFADWPSSNAKRCIWCRFGTLGSL